MEVVYIPGKIQCCRLGHQLDLMHFQEGQKKDAKHCNGIPEVFQVLFFIYFEPFFFNYKKKIAI